MRDREPSILNRTNCAYSGTVVKGKQSGEILRFLHQYLRSLVAALHHGLLTGREVRSHGGSELRLHLNSHLRRRVDNRLPSRVGITVTLRTFEKCNATMSQFCQVTKCEKHRLIVINHDTGYARRIRNIRDCDYRNWHFPIERCVEENHPLHLPIHERIRRILDLLRREAMTLHEIVELCLR